MKRVRRGHFKADNRVKVKVKIEVLIESDNFCAHAALMKIDSLKLFKDVVITIVVNFL